MTRTPIIFKAAVAVVALTLFAQLLVVAIHALLSDWRWSPGLFAVSFLARHLLGHGERRPRNQGAIERTPHDIAAPYEPTRGQWI